MLRLVPSSVLNCSVLRKILLVTLTGWLVAVAKRDLPFCSPGCGVVVTDQSVSPHACGPNPAAVFDPASNGVLQSQGLLLGWGGENFLVWQ